MKSTYREAAEVGDLKSTVSEMTDKILDIYKSHPEECTKLLLELSSVDRDLDELEKEYEILLKQL
jgi:hypothetical protein